MLTGSCACGQTKWQSSSNPQAVAACHCIPCRKTSSNQSLNYMIPRGDFKIHGSTKQWSRKGDSGKNLTYNSCPTCPTILYVEADAMPEIYIVKAGSVDDKDFFNKTGPQIELFCKYRGTWDKGWGVDEKPSE